MSIRCRGCAQINEDGRAFCSACGDALDPEVRLVMELDKRAQNRPAQPERRTTRKDDDDYVAPVRRETKKKGGGKLWVTLLVAAVLVAVWLMTK